MGVLTAKTVDGAPPIWYIEVTATVNNQAVSLTFQLNTDSAISAMLAPADAATFGDTIARAVVQVIEGIDYSTYSNTVAQFGGAIPAVQAAAFRADEVDTAL